jgi:hypothetical protein
MAKKIILAPELEHCVHKKAHALSRGRALNVYRNMEIKRDLSNYENYEMVKDPMSSFYSGLDPRRRKEAADAGMVHEDRTAIANLSNTPVHREYPPSQFHRVFYNDSTTTEDK